MCCTLLFINLNCTWVHFLFSFLWFCHQEVLVVWRVFAWEDPISVLGVFVLHPSLCPSASKSQRCSRQDLKTVWLRKKLPHENKRVFLQQRWNSDMVLVPFIPTTRPPSVEPIKDCVHFNSTADEWTGQTADNNIINASFIHIICSWGKQANAIKKTVILSLSLFPQWMFSHEDRIIDVSLYDRNCC